MNKQAIPTREQIANFLLVRPHISIASIEKEAKTYQGQLQKAITGKIELKPAMCIRVGEILKPYGFEWSEKKKKKLSAEDERDPVIVKKQVLEESASNSTHFVDGSEKTEAVQSELNAVPVKVGLSPVRPEGRRIRIKK